MHETSSFKGIVDNLTAPDGAGTPFFLSESAAVFNRDCLAILEKIPPDSINMVFADPPYMLSNGGITCRSGSTASVDKGAWDKSGGFDADAAFHSAWISACRRALKPEGTIWISGTYHSIYQCGYVLQKNGFHILNDIAWFKPNAPPNVSCRFFTASHETILWARKDKKARHTFHYDRMKNGSFPEDSLKKERTQMRSVWSIPAPKSGEKEFGGHPAQKPLALLRRIIEASTSEGDIIVDPFNGSGTTGAAAAALGGRYYIGIEADAGFCEITVNRLLQAGNKKC